MRVSEYDRVVSTVLSALILLSISVVILFSLWLSSRFLGSQAVVPVKMEELGSSEGSIGDSLEYDIPRGEDLQFDEQQVKKTLAAVADAVTDQAVLLDDPSLGGTSRTGRSGRGGQGNNPAGSGGRTGRIRRWEIEFPEGNTVETYGRQLDYFKIELAVLLPDNKVDYAYNLSKRVPDRRTGEADREQRYFLAWRRGDLEKADRELLTRAKVDWQGKPILKFLPPEVEASLAELERQHAGGNTKNIRSTRFGVRSEGNGYAFYVLDQTYNLM